MATHPIARALRINSPTIAMLTATFEAYASGAVSVPPVLDDGNNTHRR